jgi:hypothetical protein
MGLGIIVGTMEQPLQDKDGKRLIFRAERLLLFKIPLQVIYTNLSSPQKVL